MKTQLIEKSSRLYIRRLVREINKMLRRGEPVYATGYPFHIRVKSVTAATHSRQLLVTSMSLNTHAIRPEDFMDGAGRELTASREP